MSETKIQQMAFHINKALAKVQYINGQQMGDSSLPRWLRSPISRRRSARPASDQ